MREKRQSPNIQEDIDELDYQYQRKQKKGVFLSNSKVKIKGDEDFNLEFDIDDVMKFVPGLIKMVTNTFNSILPNNRDRYEDEPRYKSSSRSSLRRDKDIDLRRKRQENIKRRFGTFKENRRRGTR